MATPLRLLRSLSTKLPRPTNWRTSPFNAPQSLVASSTPTLSSDIRTHSPRRPPPKDPTPYEHRKHRLALKKAFPDGWSPPRRISRDAMDSLRMLHTHSPETFTTPVLAERFKISPEAVRRILKSRWMPDRERKEELRTKDATRKAERRKGRVRKEWEEGFSTGVLKIKEPQKPGYEGRHLHADKLELA